METHEAHNTILMVDDNLDQLKSFSALLRRAGFRLLVADASNEGFLIAKSERPDLVISSVTLAEDSGDELCRMIRADDILGTTPILLLGRAGDDRGAFAEAMRAGADDFVEMTLDPPLLVVKVVRLLERRRAGEELERRITERKRAEEKVRQLSRRNEMILNSAAEGIYGLDVNGIATFVNPSATRMTGWEAEELIGRPQHQLIHHTRADGTPYPREDCPIYMTGRDGKARRVDDEVFWRKDGSSFPVEYTSTPIREGGNLAGEVVTFNDITDRRRAEEALRESEERFRQAQKLESVGQLAGGIAHDFNNLLTAIMGYGQLSLRLLKAEDPLRRNLEQIYRAAERAAGLTRQLLAFSRKQVLQPKVLDLNAVVSDVERMLGRLIGEDVELKTALEARLASVMADPGQIEQVLMNLAVNSRDAMPYGGKLTIETANVYLDEEYAGRHVSVRPGEYVMLAITDTGCGMEPEIKERVFEPFFTTKEADKGTGLGLSTVYGIVKQSGGNIWVYSEAGVGTTFKIYLPRVDEAAQEYSRTTQTEDVALSGGETILLAEDDEMVRTFARRAMEMCGYRVLGAANGAEALSICESHKEPVHLLLTDVIMPEMGGRRLTDRLRRLRPDMKVLFMSGYADNAIVHHGVLDEGTHFIQKPFTPDTLARKVREVLDKPD